MTRERGPTPPPYALAQQIPQTDLDQEVIDLARLRTRPVLPRLAGYFRLGGPGFMNAALTLGAGTLTASMLTGATFGYRMLWLTWVSMGLGVFMMLAAARFACRGGHGVIDLQNRWHGRLVGSVMTALVGTLFVAVVFNFGQYSLGTHLLESLASALGVTLPRQINWVLYTALTSWLILAYGRHAGRGARLVETVMKTSIAVMLLSFGLCLVVVGVRWQEALRGLFIPWLPPGGPGLDLFIASSAAAVGVMDWFLLNYACLARGWGRHHEPLVRFDMTVGLCVPFVLVNWIIASVFAVTLFEQGLQPDTAPELAAALTPLLGATWAPVLFYVGFLAVPVTTTVGMSIAAAMALHAAMGWTPDPHSWRWRVSALLPQVGFLAVWYPNPIWLIIVIGAFLSLTNNIVGWSFFLLLNDRRAVGDDRSRSYLWNLGILLQITLLNSVAILYIFNRLGWWI
ncbi:MAG: divalent metal cation transporter [Acidobacteriota bacterium]|nr:divalent metal cation transporter [Acidobacteriota bacterium]